MVATPNLEATVALTGAGYVLAPTFDQAVGGQPSPDTPEVTAFEVSEGVPAWAYEAYDFDFEAEFPNFKTYLDRTSMLALGAAKRALADAGLEASARAGLEIGCAYGTCFGCLDAMGIFWQKAKDKPKFAPPLAFTHGYANSPSSLLCIEFALHGPAATFSGETLVGLEALQFAVDQLRLGSAACMLVGASESWTPWHHRHAHQAGWLSDDPADPAGLVPGEGAVFLVLENLEHARARGANVLAEVGALDFLPPEPGQARGLAGLAGSAYDVPAAAGELFAVSGLLGVLCAAKGLTGAWPAGNLGRPAASESAATGAGQAVCGGMDRETGWAARLVVHKLRS